jgi:hypothetical protein
MHIATANEEHLVHFAPRVWPAVYKFPLICTQNKSDASRCRGPSILMRPRREHAFVFPSTTYSGIPSASEYKSLNRRTQPTALTFTSFKSMLAL